MKPTALPATLAICLLTIGIARAQVVVTGTAGGKSSVNTSSFSTSGTPGALFKRTLENDLKRSGWFSLSASRQAEFSLRGSARSSAGKLRVEVMLYPNGQSSAKFKKGFSAKESETTALAHKIADMILASFGHRGMSSTKIIMVGKSGKGKELFRYDSDGKNKKQLTHDRSIAVAPGWSQDARKFVYTSYLKGFPDVYIVDIASGRRRRISKNSGINVGADISPDGRYIALVLSKDGNPELYTKNLETGTLKRMTKTKFASEGSPSWSPDGSKIVYVSDTSGNPSLYTISRNGGKAKRVRAIGMGSENVSPDWGRAGIAFSARVGGRYQIRIYNPSTGKVTAPKQDGADYEDPSWAPDERHIAATRSLNYRSQVYILDTMGDKPLALTSSKGDWCTPAWSPR